MEKTQEDKDKSRYASDMMNLDAVAPKGGFRRTMAGIGGMFGAAAAAVITMGQVGTVRVFKGKKAYEELVNSEDFENKNFEMMQRFMRTGAKMGVSGGEAAKDIARDIASNTIANKITNK